MTLNFRITQRRERFVRGVHWFYVTDTGEMGNALFAVGWDFAFADNFHSFEFCTPLDKSRKGYSHLQNGICDV